MADTTVCPTCMGRQEVMICTDREYGSYEEIPCPTCYGEGQIPIEEPRTIKTARSVKRSKISMSPAMRAAIDEILEKSGPRGPRRTK